MKKSAGGSIVFQGSISSFLGQPNCATYATMKGAIVQLARNCAYDFAKYGACLSPDGCSVRALCRTVQPYSLAEITLLYPPPCSAKRSVLCELCELHTTHFRCAPTCARPNIVLLLLYGASLDKALNAPHFILPLVFAWEIQKASAATLCAQAPWKHQSRSTSEQSTAGPTKSGRRSRSRT